MLEKLKGKQIQADKLNKTNWYNIIDLEDRQRNSIINHQQTSHVCTVF